MATTATIKDFKALALVSLKESPMFADSTVDSPEFHNYILHLLLPEVPEERLLAWVEYFQKHYA